MMPQSSRGSCLAYATATAPLAGVPGPVSYTHLVRSSRQKDTFFKRNTAQLFYRMLHFLGAEIVYNHADYRLLSRRAAKGLLSFEEVNLFLRGIVPMVGYQLSLIHI